MKDYKKIIILGSAALKIGEAGEFDYSGSQAIKALKHEGIETILVNPNIATVQTSENLADKVYFLPITVHFITKIIEKERPEGILLSFGGQTALNCGIALNKAGVFEKYDVDVLGTPVNVIESTEDRDIFAKKLDEINVKTALSQAVGSVEDALKVAEEIKYPVMVRIAYALGGLGSGVCYNKKELNELASRAFSYTEQILIEEYLQGWKEVEYEIVRDSYDNCIAVCNMENFDPLGIHTGESIVVAPSQTLNNEEYHTLRSIGIETVRHLGIVGECNIQYALDPNSNEYRVIEVNARLSRSSALASKATGYPLALIAAKIALGYALPEINNSITQTTMACFEPSLDYIAVKIPRWDLKKFVHIDKKIGSSMKSVGEVMALGRNFQETIQKAVRMLDINALGIVCNENLGQKSSKEEIIKELKNPTDERVFTISQAMKSGMSIDEIHEITYIDRWFLAQLEIIVKIEQELEKYADGICPKDILLKAKQAGFSDIQIAKILKSDEITIQLQRKNYGIEAFVKQIDTLGGEYPAKTNYLYLTYNGEEDDVVFQNRKTILALGSGAYRIGSSVEFDWSSVFAARTAQEEGFYTLILNNNPETVSTDYDEANRLYFDEISLENIVTIAQKEKIFGVIVSMGGQKANNLAMPLSQQGVPILGTPPESINMAENRMTFSKLLDDLEIAQPAWNELSTKKQAEEFAEKISYPVLIRPSYVLSGAAMGIATNHSELSKYLDVATTLSPEYPVVISKFIDNAKELEFDGVAKDGKVLIYAISEHVENAGVHSGDSTLVFPAQRVFLETTRKIIKVAKKISANLKITGPFNIQFMAKGNRIQVIECNLRASRSFPFISKVSKKNFIKIATRAILNAPKSSVPVQLNLPDYVGVKASQFSFTRLQSADPTLGVEMTSTGEVGCFGDDFNEALLKALISVGFYLPIKSVLISSGAQNQKIKFLESCQLLREKNIAIYCTEGTYQFLKERNIECTLVHWPDENKKPNVIDVLESKQVDLVINIPKNNLLRELDNDYKIRRKAVDFAIPLITNLQLAIRFVEAIHAKEIEDLKILSWSEH